MCSCRIPRTSGGVSGFRICFNSQPIFLFSPIHYSVEMKKRGICFFPQVGYRDFFSVRIWDCCPKGIVIIIN